MHLRWDIFCRVIDNYGDIGACWRLARQLANRGQQVRLWVDDTSALAWMAPDGAHGVTVHPWRDDPPADLQDAEKGDVLIEAFGCDIPPPWVLAVSKPQAEWINLEYLSAESYVERSHGLPSPVLTGPLAGRTKRFFYPGFTEKTGGLLREPDLQHRQQQFDRATWLAAQGIAHHGEELVSLFCYENAALPGLLAQLAQRRAQLLVTAGRATAAVRACAIPPGLLVHELPFLSQDDYDHLLWSCELNFVRGEDTLVRALWSGKAFVWQLYPQQDHAHHAKLQAFLDCIDAPPSLRAFHAAWNGLPGASLPAPGPSAWETTALRAREHLLAQSDLVSQLLAAL